ncbi:Myxococcus xanthus paralogous family TIGR02268 [Stigmatella aurantiaca]|uniref:Myxococcus xanthus paralogous family TIGR02268 n=1 Tax=Stigmatella aurantiaca TaxID=41 RepID=A0A1H7V1R1_STIAU|nr:Myxococcus xanthus paralogous family TIGR02268 [Stigmatella aurantiaca]
MGGASSARDQTKTLTFDESRIRVLDTGALSVIVQAVTNLKEGERHEIGVLFADGRAPSRAAFVLVTDPSEMDTRIDVRRPEMPAAPCPAEAQPRAPLPEDFVLLGYVDEAGVSVIPIESVDDQAQGLATNWGFFYPIPS